jgi:aminoacrylate hydrolase
MARIDVSGVEIFYESKGRGSLLLLLAGLAGVGRNLGPQFELFAQRHCVILPDHRGTGRSSKTTAGQTIAQHAQDMAALIRAQAKGPAHIVGTSTGGAIAQLLALEHPEVVKTITIACSWAGPDPYLLRQFQLRRRFLAEGPLRAAEVSALFLWDPQFQSRHPDKVSAWVAAAATAPFHAAIAEARIAMILAHDQRARLGDIRCPVLVVAAHRDHCTPRHLSEEIKARIPHAELAILEGGHFVFLEDPHGFNARIAEFLAKHDG